MSTFDIKRNIRSFGRVNGRKVGSKVKFLLTQMLPRYSLDLQKLISRTKKSYLEIGFGYGESLAARAEIDPETDYIGCETYRRGIANLVGLILTKNLTNTHIFDGDARILLEKLTEDCLDGIFILFPDPWPKRRQNKKRIVNIDFLKLARKKLKNGGTLFFASDFKDYTESVLNMIFENNIFTSNSKNLENYKTEPSWWIETRYQKKAKELGNKIYFMEFTKV